MAAWKENKNFFSEREKNTIDWRLWILNDAAVLSQTDGRNSFFFNHEVTGFSKSLWDGKWWRNVNIGQVKMFALTNDWNKVARTSGRGGKRIISLSPSLPSPNFWTALEDARERPSDKVTRVKVSKIKWIEECLLATMNFIRGGMLWRDRVSVFHVYLIK